MHKPGLPLAWSAQALATIMTQIDETPEALKDALVAAFHDERLTQQERLDRRQQFATELRAEQKKVSGIKAEVDAYLARLKAIENEIKADALDAVMALPDVELRGSTGRKLYASSSTKVVYGIDIKRKSFEVIDPDVDVDRIDARFLKSVIAMGINKDEVEAALKAGEILPFAQLQITPHVVGLFPPEKKDKADE